MPAISRAKMMWNPLPVAWISNRTKNRDRSRRLECENEDNLTKREEEEEKNESI